MTHLLTRKQLVVFTLQENIFIYHRKQKELRRVITLPPVTKHETNGKPSSNEPEVNPEITKISIDCLALSSCGNLMTACDSEKRLFIYKFNQDRWTLSNQRTVCRKCVKVTFTNDNKSVIIAEKTGDVHKYSVTEDSRITEDRLLLGHLSMLLDMVITTDDKHIITADRDEKIRVSCYPNSYTVNSYCLGHKEFVSCLQQWPFRDDVFVSGSGDGSVRFWNYRDGEMLHCRRLHDDFRHVRKTKTDAAEIHQIDDDAERKPDIYKVDDDYVAVKILQCSPVHPVVAIVCDRYMCVKLFAVKDDRSNDEFTLEETQQLDLLCERLNFDDDGNLWTLGSTDGNTYHILIYAPKNTDDGDVKFHLIDDEGQLKVIRLDIDEKIISNGGFHDSSNLAELYKHWFDNVKTYMERKQERICLKNSRKDGSNFKKKKKL